MGFTALFLGYVLPLLIVIACLLILTSIKVSELLSGLTSVAILIPYYLTLFLFRKRVNKKFSFRLKVR